MSIISDLLYITKLETMVLSMDDDDICLDETILQVVNVRQGLYPVLDGRLAALYSSGQTDRFYNLLATSNSFLSTEV